MKNKFSFLTALWWILLLAVLGFFLLAATDKHSRESEDENRMLAAFPTLSGKSLADASFMNGFEDFLSGRVLRARRRDEIYRPGDGQILRAYRGGGGRSEGRGDGQAPAGRGRGGRGESRGKAGRGRAGGDGGAAAPPRRRSRFMRMSRRLRTRWTIRTKTWKKSRCSAATRSSARTRAICG